MMPWDTFIASVILLGCIAMVLSGFDFARPYLSLASTQYAEAKGLQLLLDNLTQEQRVQYQAFGFLMWLARKQGSATAFTTAPRVTSLNWKGEAHWEREDALCPKANSWLVTACSRKKSH